MWRRMTWQPSIAPPWRACWARRCRAQGLGGTPPGNLLALQFSSFAIDFLNYYLCNGEPHSAVVAQACALRSLRCRCRAPRKRSRPRPHVLSLQVSGTGPFVSARLFSPAKCFQVRGCTAAASSTPAPPPLPAAASTLRCRPASSESRTVGRVFCWRLVQATVCG